MYSLLVTIGLLHVLGLLLRRFLECDIQYADIPK